MNSPIPPAQGHMPRSSVLDSGFTSRRPRPRGFTLIEMLVALAITLVMMGAVVTLFGVISESVSASRSGIEMSDRLRAARNQLQRDLGGVTATMQPPLRPENDEGYFEIIEGRITDSDFSATAQSMFGDVDDVLMFTTRSRGAPFLGKYNGTVIESPVAEVVYFLVQNGPVVDASTAPPTRLCTLYRRVFLVAPGLPTIGTFDDHFYDQNDTSIRYELLAGMPTLVPNTLGDLTKRENRFAHYGTPNYLDFPFLVNRSAIPPNPAVPLPVLSPPMPWPSGPPPRPTESAFLAPAIDVRIGDDVLLNNVVAFDVQVWDPGAPLFAQNGVIVEPNAPRLTYTSLLGTSPTVYGAYVDLGYAPTYTPAFGAPTPLFHLVNPDIFATYANGSPLPVPNRFGQTANDYRVYDTWSLHYENDGLARDGSPITATNPGDLGTNGLDDDGDGIVDELDEYDALPPYSAPLRGIRVTIRVYEPSSQQVREAVVLQDFLPE